MNQYSYKRGHELSDKEIQQQAEALAELEALKKVEVNLYVYSETLEATTRCQQCFVTDEGCASLEYIDKAADWDECAVCGAQNVPSWYHGQMF